MPNDTIQQDTTRILQAAAKLLTMLDLPQAVYITICYPENASQHDIEQLESLAGTMLKAHSTVVGGNTDISGYTFN
jgi:hypothetical protein